MLEFMKQYYVVVNILIFLSGLILGNKLAIGRDKRKEFNMIAVPIYQELVNQIENLKLDKYKSDALKKEELINFSIYLSKRKQKKFMEAINLYENCFETKLLPVDPFRASGSQLVTNAKSLKELKEATEKLLPYCNPR